ncbi:TOMM precursor leader peptide-binding protein [Paenibacillus cymbidii]|uniref:TOMM precursor leader peptide-binding protein n=1 Tax=Paenibacillus cymbidii TaxID=1639034 RepID=UPI001081FF39|nr:TOMM precursor leader peptide-binding protein [Paenibacillus cymbidii]
MKARNVAAVVGDGLLADLVCEKLLEQDGDLEVVRGTNIASGVPETAKLVIVAYDEERADEDAQTQAELRRLGMPWLCGFIALHEAVVGPLVRPGKPGCPLCAGYRRREPEEVQEQLLARLIAPDDNRHEERPSRTAIRQTACLLAAEAWKALRNERPLTEEHVYLMRLDTLECSLHFFLPDPMCPVCGQLRDDTEEAATIVLKPNPKPYAGEYRCRPLSELKLTLARDYVDARTGLFNGKYHHLASAFANVSVNWPSPMGDEVTGGRGHSYAESEMTAILEGLERYCGLSPRGKRTVVRDSYRHVAAHALDPTRVGVYAKEQYALQGFPFEPFDPDRPIDWVWGYSFGQERPLLVPELLAYCSLPFAGGHVHETTNGCALGGSLEEAILYGMLEVVERDSFLMAWYAQLPAPGLDPATAGDKELTLMIERLHATSGYEVLLFDTTTENGIPSIWAVAKNRRAAGANLICAAGAHLDPARAAKSAIHELANTVLMLGEYDEESREEAGQMYRDATLVRQMSDHALLYGLPEAEARLRFLLGGDRPLHSFGERFKRKRNHSDLTDDLKMVLQTFRDLRLDVIVVDQTAAETLRNGLHSVKTIIPGMLPMTFGHERVRLTGLDRLYHVPVALGYADQPLTAERINPYPHPFP